MKNADVIFYPVKQYACGCTIWHDYTDIYNIEYCPKHKAAPKLLKACKIALSYVMFAKKQLWNEYEDKDTELIKRAIIQAELK